MSKTKKKSSAAKKVAIFFIVIMIIEILALVGVSRVFKNDDVTPSFAGYSVFLMDSANMDDKIPKNALVLAEELTPSRDKIGKAVLCENVPGIGTSVFWLSDVVSKGDNVDGVIYKVYQNNDPKKIYEVRGKDIVGVTDVCYVEAGKVIKFVTSYIGMAVCIIIPLLLLIIIELIIAIAKHLSSNNRKEHYNYNDEPEETLEDFLNEKERHQNVDTDDYSDDESYDLNLNDDAEDEQSEAEDDEEYTEDTVDDDESSADEEENTEVIAHESEQKSEPKNAEDSVSSTRQTASASLEELMRMMEEEQQKLKEQLK